MMRARLTTLLLIMIMLVIWNVKDLNIIFLFRSFIFSWFFHCATLVCLLLEGTPHVGLQWTTSLPERLADTV